MTSLTSKNKFGNSLRGHSSKFGVLNDWANCYYKQAKLLIKLMPNNSKFYINIEYYIDIFLLFHKIRAW